MSDQDTLIESLTLQIISRHSGLPVSEIKPTDRLLHDLGVDGDDAAELLIEMIDTFGLEEKPIFLQYFRPEPTIDSILRMPSTKKGELAAKIPRQVSDLVNLARTKKWPVAGRLGR